MTMQASGIIALLPTLNTSELSLVENALKSLSGSNEQSQGTANVGKTERLLFDAAVAELKSAGYISGHIAFDNFSKIKGYKNWQRSIPIVEAFMRKAFRSSKIKEIEQRTIFRILIRSIIQDLKKIGISVSLNTVATNLHRVPEAFDRSFPGYARSGLAHLVVAALRRKS